MQQKFDGNALNKFIPILAGTVQPTRQCKTHAVGGIITWLLPGLHTVDLLGHAHMHTPVRLHVRVATKGGKHTSYHSQPTQPATL